LNLRQDTTYAEVFIVFLSTFRQMPGSYLSSCPGYFEIVLYSSFTVINSFNVAASDTDHVIKS